LFLSNKNDGTYSCGIFFKLKTENKEISELEPAKK
jgi:hypothetical protein